MHCTTEKFTIGKLLVEKNVFDLSPPYQRESAIWPRDKQQLFLDSILNSYDIPKIYIHDLRHKGQRYQYAVIDGKQRLDAIWRFLDDKLKLADDFEYYGANAVKPLPKPGDKFSGLSEHWRETFKSRSLDFVLVQGASDEDIEDLFSRLNNGEPLNAAEKRNAKGGDTVKLIRDLAKHKFFTDYVPFANTRYQHYEVAAKFLLIEKSRQDSGDGFCDLKKRFLDAMVEDNRQLTAAKWRKLEDGVGEGIARLCSVFEKKDQALSKQAYAPLYFLFLEMIYREYGHKTLKSKLRKFVETFDIRRQENLQRPEDERDPVLVEFGRLMQQGTNDLSSLRERVSILRRYFLEANPDVELLDKKRAFSVEERWVLWLKAGKKCTECLKDVRLEDIQADHQTQWAHGGKTTLDNGRALCATCNNQFKSPRD